MGKKSKQCTAITKRGTQCSRRAVAGTDRCERHPKERDAVELPADREALAQMPLRTTAHARALIEQATAALMRGALSPAEHGAAVRGAVAAARAGLLQVDAEIEVAPAGDTTKLGHQEAQARLLTLLGSG